MMATSQYILMENVSQEAISDASPLLFYGCDSAISPENSQSDINIVLEEISDARQAWVDNLFCKF